LYTDSDLGTVDIRESPMPLTENEARRRRLLTKEAFKFLNARVLDKKTFTRSELFGPESVGKGALVEWSRDITNRLRIQRKIVALGPNATRPTYRAIEVVKMTDDDVAKYLGYLPDDEDLPAPPASLAAEIKNVEPLDDHIVEANTAATVGSDDAQPEDASIHQMLASLVSILPDLVRAVHRIEKKAVAIESRLTALEATQKKIDENMAYLLELIPEKK
jgi:hypothetical protein